MHDLIPLGPALPGALTAAEIDLAMAYAAAEKAPATRTAYASDWQDFAAWCASRGARALPAHVGIVAAYLSGLADSGRKASTIGRRAASIAYHHNIAGHEPPTDAEGVRAVLRGIRRTVGVASKGKTAARPRRIRLMLDACPNSMIGLARPRPARARLRGCVPPVGVGRAAGIGSHRGARRLPGADPPQQDRSAGPGPGDRRSREG